MTTGTYEFGTTVPALPDGERLKAIARSVTDICIHENKLYHQQVLISHDAVFNGSGDLKWINFGVKVWDIEYSTAVFVKQALGNLGLHVSISEANIPDDCDTMGMFTRAGADHLRTVLEGVEEDLRDGSLSPVKLRDEVGKRLKVLETAGHGEVYDTAVREVIWERLDRVLESLGIRLLDA